MDHERIKGTVLERIARSTLRRVDALKERQARAGDPHPFAHAPGDFAAPFRAPGLHVIAEVKKASPSRGEIAPHLDPVEVARAYEANGAGAVSVLTEPEFFQGSVQCLASIRGEVGLPLLMKDFFVDPAQLIQARVHGADCVLLMVSMLGDRFLGPMMEGAADLGLSTLVEVHDQEELDIALRHDARIIGVNNRDLKTLKVDLETSHRLAPGKNHPNRVFICESGIHDPGEMKEFVRLGYRGFLIGTHFMQTGDPGPALARLLAEGQS
jgi:indole-3-glycerol phosphate synthase